MPAPFDFCREEVALRLLLAGSCRFSYTGVVKRSSQAGPRWRGKSNVHIEMSFSSLGG